MVLHNFLKKYIYPIAVMTGSIIGVGFFSLPYIAMRVGTWIMLAYFLIIATIVVIVHLMFAEISLKTPDFKRFPGFVRKHLGERPMALAFISTIASSYGVLLAYLIVGSEFLKNIFHPYFGGNQFIYAIIYFSFISIIIWIGAKAVARVEFMILISLFLGVIFISLRYFEWIKISNLFAGNTFKISNLFLPYGPILFSLWGVGLIPEVEEMTAKNKSVFKKIIIWATLIPAVFYVFFTFLILSITGQQTTESAFIGLADFLGIKISFLFFTIGTLTTITASIATGLTLKKVLIYDLKIKKLQAFIMTCSVPVILFLAGFKSFIGLISLVGGIFLGIDGILILLMYKKITGKKFLPYSLMMLFVLGIFYEIFLKIAK